MPRQERSKCFHCDVPHNIKGTVRIFKPVSKAAAKSLVGALEIPSGLEVKPWVNPIDHLSYANGIHVMLRAPFSKGHPTTRAATISMCNAAYQRKGTCTHYLVTKVPIVKAATCTSSGAGATPGDAEGSSTPSYTEVCSSFVPILPAGVVCHSDTCTHIWVQTLTTYCTSTPPYYTHKNRRAQM